MDEHGIKKLLEGNQGIQKAFLEALRLMNEDIASLREEIDKINKLLRLKVYVVYWEYKDEFHISNVYYKEEDAKKWCTDGSGYNYEEMEIE